jgi:hypothetical protein
MLRAFLIVAVLLAAVPAAAAAAPVATTGVATSRGPTSATVLGTVDPQGDATTYHVEYGTTTDYGARTPKTPASSR